jgi:hypothetical protein
MEAEHVARREVDEALIVERQFGGYSLGGVGGQPGVDQAGGELVEHEPGVAAGEGADLGDDALVELDLTAHRDPLAGGHREGPGDQAGEPGDPHLGGPDVGAGDGEDQAQVGDQPVVDAEHRRACRAAPDGRHARRELGGVACRILHPRLGAFGERAPRRECVGHMDSRSRSASTTSAWRATSVTSYA